MLQRNYIFSPSLLNAFSNYLSCEKVWEKYYGFSEEPKISLEDFEKQTFDDFINTINKVETEPSEAADRGTCFNEVVDLLVHNIKPTQCEVQECKQDDGKIYGYNATMNGFEFFYPIELVNIFVAYYEPNKMAQYHASAILTTKYGNVKLHGYIDEMNPLSVHDIKTTTSYEPFKYENTWQHKVYPYCLRKNGSKVDTFVYDVCFWPSKKDGKVDTKTFEIHHEKYVYDDERCESELVGICEDLIDFLEENKSLITNEKVFGKE